MGHMRWSSLSMYYPTRENRLFDAITHDTRYIQHELLKLRIRVIVFKTIWDRQYAEDLVNGKADSNELLFIDSTIYQWLLWP